MLKIPVCRQLIIGWNLSPCFWFIHIMVSKVGKLNLEMVLDIARSCDEFLKFLAVLSE